MSFICKFLSLSKQGSFKPFTSVQLQLHVKQTETLTYTQNTGAGGEPPK